MISPDKNIVRSISFLSTHGESKPYWDEIVEWFRRSYADRSTKNVSDIISSEKLEHINQGRAVELLDICKYLNQNQKEDTRNDGTRTRGLENF